jgi:hypothetical protein
MPRAQIVKSGTWLYDGSVPHEVWIVKQDFDYYDDGGYEDEPESLNSDGEVFQTVIARDGKVTSVLPATYSLEDAITRARHTIPQDIEWDDHRLQPLFGGRNYLLSAR